MAKYDHVFSLHFSAKNNNLEGATQQELIVAIMRRLADLVNNDELAGACGSPETTMEKGSDDGRKKVEVTSISATLSFDDVVTMSSNKLKKEQGSKVAEIYNRLSGHVDLQYDRDSMFKLVKGCDLPPLKWFAVTRKGSHDHPCLVKAIDFEHAVMQAKECNIEELLDREWEVEEADPPEPKPELRYFRVSLSFQDVSTGYGHTDHKPHSETRVIQVYVKALQDSRHGWTDDDVVAYAVDRGLVPDHEASDEAVDRTVSEITEEEFISCTCRR